MNYSNQDQSLARKAFNILLWTLQILWRVFFRFTRFGRSLCQRPPLGYGALGSRALVLPGLLPERYQMMLHTH
jgi:hypothetical protein